MNPHQYIEQTILVLAALGDGRVTSVPNTMATMASRTLKAIHDRLLALEANTHAPLPVDVVPVSAVNDRIVALETIAHDHSVDGSRQT